MVYKLAAQYSRFRLQGLLPLQLMMEVDDSVESSSSSPSMESRDSTHRGWNKTTNVAVRFFPTESGLRMGRLGEEKNRVSTSKVGRKGLQKTRGEFYRVEEYMDKLKTGRISVKVIALVG